MGRYVLLATYPECQRTSLTRSWLIDHGINEDKWVEADLTHAHALVAAARSGEHVFSPLVCVADGESGQVKIVASGFVPEKLELLAGRCYPDSFVADDLAAPVRATSSGV